MICKAYCFENLSTMCRADLGQGLLECGWIFKTRKQTICWYLTCYYTPYTHFHVDTDRISNKPIVCIRFEPKRPRNALII